MIRIFNTLSGRIEQLPRHRRGKPLRIFVCGPTVYDYSHIGHARTYIVFDAFVRFLRSQKIPVFYLQNITDIDDKIINRARESRETPRRVASRFTREHLKDMKTLGIVSVNRYAPATKFISQIVAQVQKLVTKGYAYKIEDEGYYFEVSKFKEYGKLARRTELRAEDGISRIDESIKKRDPRDFCLWKFQRSQDEPSWKTALGLGRPGWHIEDTAISEKFFGPQYDMHGGAIDLIFPHHEAEITQQEAASGKKPFVKLWMHTGFLLVDGEKMSKSLGNFITIRELLARYPASIFRFSILLSHWRSPLNFSSQLMGQAENSFETIMESVRLIELVSRARRARRTTSLPIRDLLIDLRKKFIEALSQNFNTPVALSALFTALHRIHPNVFSFSSSDAKQTLQTITSLLASIGISIPKSTIPASIVNQVKKRELFRSNKQFIQADALRKKVESLGYGIEDTPLGPLVWHKLQNFHPKI